MFNNIPIVQLMKRVFPKKLSVDSGKLDEVVSYENDVIQDLYSVRAFVNTVRLSLTVSLSSVLNSIQHLT